MRLPNVAEYYHISDSGISQFWCQLDSVLLEAKLDAMKPKSDNLFHFTKSLDVLKLILKNGIYPRYSIEDCEWFGIEGHEYVAFPMTCFCDIPLSRIAEHTDFYGNFGLGFSKDWGLKNKLNPVIYSPQGGIAQSLMKFLISFKLVDKDMQEEIQHPNEIPRKAIPLVQLLSLKQKEVHENSFRLWSLLKPTHGKMVVSGKFVEKEFFQESEWRYVPPVGKSFTFDDEEDLMNFNDGVAREKANSDIEKYKLQFSPADLRYIFVERDNDISSLIEYIDAELGRFPENDLKILQSRIVSLDTLQRDL